MTGLSQRIYLTSAGTSGNHAVVSASVAVHGLTPQSRVVPVQSGDERAQASRKLKVSFSSDASGAAGADLAVRGFSAVLSIDVDSVTFADGSTWKSAAGACRVIPDPVMLIGSF